MFEYNDPIRTDPIAAIAHTNCIDFFASGPHDNNKIIAAAAPLAEFHFFTPFKAICFLPVIRKISLQQHKQKACQLDFCIKHPAFFTKIVKTA